MFKHLLNRKIVDKAVFAKRWAWMVGADTDIGTLVTSHPLASNRRILVPVDVQAYVAHANIEEELVPVTGGPGDPAPFTAGAKPEPGIHLHWAMPDALLRGKESSTGGKLEMKELPDRWVVIRSLFPIGLERPLLRGWIIDSKKGSVTPLHTFSGTTVDNDDLPNFDRLDGIVGGSPLWTASYTASSGRFAFHDRLEDLNALRKVATKGFDQDAATYVIAGWCSDISKDPLKASGKAEMIEQLRELGWHLDAEDDESSSSPDTPEMRRMMDSRELIHTKEFPVTRIVTKGRTETFIYADVSPKLSIPVESPSRVVIAQSPPRFLTLLHGMVTGVPVDRPPAGLDERPLPQDLSVAIGFDPDDLVTALGASTLGSSPSQRRVSEMVAAAFTSDLLDRLGTPDGMRDIAEREHNDTFRSLPGKPLPAAQPDQLRVEDSASVNATTVGRKGRAARAAQNTGGDNRFNTLARWRDQVGFAAENSTPQGVPYPIGERQTSGAAEGRRIVQRPAPRIFIPQAPQLAIKGARPSLRHHYDGLYDDEGRLRCRYPNEAIKAIKGVISGQDLVPTLGSGAIPAEVLTVVREAMLLNPYCTFWLAQAAARDTNQLPKYQARIKGEMLRMFSPDGRYDGTGEYTLQTIVSALEDAWTTVSTAQEIKLKQVAAELAKSSYLAGMPPSPVGVTSWRQPWVPLWLEWRVKLVGTTDMSHWQLDDLELKPRPGDGKLMESEISGRSPIGRGLSTALHASIERWIKAEQERDATDATLSSSQQNALQALAGFLAPLDLASASLDGIREQMLGLDYRGGFHSGVGEDDRPKVVGEPVPLFGGTLELRQLRLVDAFGRTLDVPVATALTTTSLEVEGEPATIRMAARLQNGARWLFRLVDPAFQGDPASAPEAFINQLEPEQAVNPVAGFLLPDHIDESLELFDRNGHALGQICHHEITGAVRWEPAPGRLVPPGAGPLLDLDPGAIPMGQIAAGVVRTDVQNRASATPSADSSLTTLLRAIDTTLWTVDTYGSLGSSTVAGLVGRPIAVVKATLRLDVPDDLNDVNLNGADASARRAAFEALRDQAFPVQLGDLQRSDDALLGYYLNDDYDHFYLVDKVVAAIARDSGRSRGQLGLLGMVTVPDEVPLSHPFLVPEDTLYIRPGQTYRLTLLMLPAGRVHLTSGILPRKALALNDAWVGKGLKRVIPSVRVGPVLVDPEEIRLPKVHLLGDKQQFTRRNGPLTWRDDPIISATQSALLPRIPHEFQEGWIRIIEEGE
jgi:hypothetical protein